MYYIMVIIGIQGSYFRMRKYSDFFSFHPHSPLTKKAQDFIDLMTHYFKVQKILTLKCFTAEIDLDAKILKSIRGQKIELHINYVVWVLRVNIKNKSTLRSLGRIKGCEKSQEPATGLLFQNLQRSNNEKNFFKRKNENLPRHCGYPHFNIHAPKSSMLSLSKTSQSTSKNPHSGKSSEMG